MKKKILGAVWELPAKGQLISKGNFSVFNSPKKNLKMLIFTLAYWGRNFLFVFWKNLKHQKKRHLEIN